MSVRVGRAHALRGHVRVPGDKSITHRALFFGAINASATTIVGGSPAADCSSTLTLVHRLGVDVVLAEDEITLGGSPRVERADDHLTLDCGNSGTTARLAMGLLAAERGSFTLTGDASLSRRPMERVAEPLRRIGASIETTGGTLPVRIEGRALAGGGSHGLIAVESAQVHAALVLAALRSRGGATLFAARPMRDHTLRMLRRFGCEPLTSAAGVHRILPASIDRATRIEVPGDFSSAAFLVTAALLVPGSQITVDDVGLNPTRIAFLSALARMGAPLRVEVGDDAFEPVGRIHVTAHGGLTGATFGESDDTIAIAEMIDELPLLALVATQAHGRTVVRGAEELRVKESDRIAATAAVLRALGAEVIEREDGFEIEGPQRLRGGASIDPHGDHRLAMMAAVGAMLCERDVVIENADVASVSYPGFWSEVERLGGAMQPI
jgi:3-phosphoshikimate 1-carboxyvinyltransferase